MVKAVTLQNGVQTEADVLNQTEADALYVGVGNTQTVTGAKTFQANTTFTGDIAVNGGDITTTATTFNVATAATSLQVGANAALLRLGTNVGIGIGANSSHTLGLSGTFTGDTDRRGISQGLTVNSEPITAARTHVGYSSTASSLITTTDRAGQSVTFRGINLTAQNGTVDGTQDVSLTELTGARFVANERSGSTVAIPNVSGIQTIALHSGTAATTSSFGARFSVTTAAAFTGTVTNAFGVNSELSNSGGSISTAYGVRSQFSGAVPIPKIIGYFIDVNNGQTTTLDYAVEVGQPLKIGHWNAGANTEQVDLTIAADGSTSLDVSSTAPALRVTQRGTGDALLVEDSANPDATPFRIDNAGNLITANNVTADGITSVKNLVYQSPNQNGAGGSPVRRIVGGYSQNTVANTLYEIGRFVFNADAQTISAKIKIQAMTGTSARYFDINLQLRTNGNADMGVRYTIVQDEFDVATLNLASIEIYFLPFNAVGPVLSRTAVVCLRTGNTTLQNINWLFDIFERNTYNNFTQTESLTVFDPTGFSLVEPYIDPTGLTFSQRINAPTVTASEYLQNGVPQGFVKKYGSGYTATSTAGTVYNIARINFTGIQHVVIRGVLALFQVGARQIQFMATIRATTANGFTKTIRYNTDESQFDAASDLGSFGIYDNPATGDCYLTYTAGATATIGVSWSFETMERETREFVFMENAQTVLNTNGLTLVPVYDDPTGRVITEKIVAPRFTGNIVGDDATYGTPSTIGAANNAGSGTLFARANHIHAHGNQAGGTTHAAATQTVNGFLSAEDKTKLDNATPLEIPQTLILRDQNGDVAFGTHFAQYYQVGTAGNPIPPEGVNAAKQYMVFLDTGTEIELHLWVPE